MTAQGGQTSHAAVVARNMGKPCIVACTDILVDYSRELFYAGDAVVQKRRLDNDRWFHGRFFEGKVPTLPPATGIKLVQTFLQWADQFATLKVRTNADNGMDATQAS